MMHRCRLRCRDRDEGCLLRQVFLPVPPNPFMNKVSVGVVGQRDTGNRVAWQRTFGNDLGFEGFGIGTALLWHGASA